MCSPEVKPYNHQPLNPKPRNVSPNRGLRSGPRVLHSTHKWKHAIIYGSMQSFIGSDINFRQVRQVVLECLEYIDHAVQSKALQVVRHVVSHIPVRRLPKKELLRVANAGEHAHLGGRKGGSAAHNEESLARSEYVTIESDRRFVNQLFDRLGGSKLAEVSPNSHPGP